MSDFLGGTLKKVGTFGGFGGIKNEPLSDPREPHFTVFTGNNDTVTEINNINKMQSNGSRLYLQ